MYQKEYALKEIKNKNNGEIVLLSNIFYNIETTIENVKYTIKDNSDNLKIILESENMDNKELDEIFWKLYAYINIVIGYYPELLSGPQVNVTCLAEKYKTGEKHIYSDVCFIGKITSKKFKESYEKFLKKYGEISFQMDYYSVATSKTGDYYCQIAIVNILQCLDGIYECLEITKKKRCYLTKKQAKKIHKKVENIGLSSITHSKIKQNKIKIRLKESIKRIDEENYDTKLTNLFNYIEDKYKVFHFENNEDLKKFINKCKSTRNKFSHASKEIKDKAIFDGKESAFYLYKLMLVFRLLIIDEIGLGKLVNEKLLKELIINIDSWKCKMLIKQYLNKEGEDDGE